MFLVLAVAALSVRGAQAIAAQPHKEPVPSEIAAPVKSVLADGGVRAVASGVTIDFWWVKSLPVTATPPSWLGVEEGALVGAARIGGDFRDIRGRIIRAGVYTLRFGVQPDNGDHLGTSPFREFLLLVPASADSATLPLGHNGTIDLSKQTVGGSHPAVWSIDPPVTNEARLAPHTTELGHQAIVMDVPCARDGKPAGTLKFGVVLVGRIEA